MAEHPGGDLLQTAARLSETIVETLMANHSSMTALNYDFTSLVGSESSDKTKGKHDKSKGEALEMYLTQRLSSQGTGTTCSTSSQDVSTAAGEIHSPISSLLNQLRTISEGSTSPCTYPALQLPNVFSQYTQEQKKAYDKDAVAAVNSANMEQLRAWHKQGRPLKAANPFGESLLHIACRRGCLEVTKFLVLEAGVSVWARDEQGVIPMHLACRTNKPNYYLVDFLLEQDSDMLYVSDKRGSTPLDYTPKDTWPAWNKYFAEKDIKTLQPKRKEFYVATKISPRLQKEIDQATPITMLHDVDSILREYTAQKKDRKSARIQRGKEEGLLQRSEQPKRAIAMQKEESSTLTSREASPLVTGGERTKSLKNALSSMIRDKLNNSLSSGSSNQTADALNLLEGISAIDPLMLLETIRQKRTLDFEISHMEKIEAQFDKKQEEKQALTDAFKLNKLKLVEAENRAKNAMAAEVAARKALEKAQRDVEAAKLEWMVIHKECTFMEESWNKANVELDSISSVLSSQEEKIHSQMHPTVHQGLSRSSSTSSNLLVLNDHSDPVTGIDCSDDITVTRKTNRRPSLPKRDASRSGSRGRSGYNSLAA
jgi:Ankyrin repeats (3 copies)